MNRRKTVVIATFTCVSLALLIWGTSHVAHRNTSLPAPGKAVVATSAAPAVDPRPLVERVPHFPYFQNWAKRIAPDDPFSRINLNGMLSNLGYERVTSTEELRTLLYQVKGRDEGKAMWKLWEHASQGEEREKAVQRAIALEYPAALQWSEGSIENVALRCRALVRTIELARAGDPEAMMDIAQGAYAAKKPLVGKPSPIGGVLREMLTEEEKDDTYWYQKASDAGYFQAAHMAAQTSAGSGGAKALTNLTALAESGDYLAAKELFERAVRNGEKAEQDKWYAKVVELTGSKKTVDEFLAEWNAPAEGEEESD